MTDTKGRVVLVVDDDDMIRRLVRTVLEADEFEVAEATDGESALALANSAQPAVVVLDIMMPGIDGVEVCRRLDHERVKVIVLTARDDPDLENDCRLAGANAFVTKPFSSIELLDLVAELIATLSSRMDLANSLDQGLSDPERFEQQLQQLARDAVAAYRKAKSRATELEEALATLETAFLETVRSLAFVVEAKDAYTGQHLERCRVYGVALMKELHIHDEYPDAQYGFLLHDAGKVGVPERILGKPGPLTAAEWRVMRTHPLIGYQIVSGIPFLKNAAEIVRSHHEMFDGSGYPAGLRGDEIPVPARVFSVVDAFDAMTTDRPYRSARSLDHAVGELRRMAGTQFDPDVVAAFVPLAKEFAPAGLPAPTNQP